MSGPKFSVANQTGLRGAGFGNEIIAWGKSYLASHELGLKLLKPMWGFNRYHLAEWFGWNETVTRIRDAFLRVAPRVLVSEEMYRATNEDDYGRAVRLLSARGALGDRPLVAHEGMWGGYLAIRRARPFLLANILAAPGVAAAVGNWQDRNLEGTPNIGVHVRRGDFGSRPPGPGDFNSAVPLSWFVDLVSSMSQRLGGRVAFTLCSDADDDALGPLPGLPGVRPVRGIGSNAGLQELAILSQTDALIASVSSFSMTAAFLSDRPYFWFAPQLTMRDNAYSLWGHEDAQLRDGSATARSVSSEVESLPRGIPCATGDDVPSLIAENLRSSAEMRNPARDLIYYGVVPK
jgi:hypothetical protein